MKRILLTALFIFVLGNLNIANAMEIGTVDYAQMYAKIPQSIAIKKQIDAKFEEIKKYSIDTKKIIDSNKSNAEKRKLVEPRVEHLKKLKMEYNDLRKKQEDIVIAKTKAAAEVVLKSKKVDVIINKNYLVGGGIDVTQDVLRAVK